MRVLLTVACGLVLGCATHKTTISLDRAVALELRLESTELRAGTSARARFHLRNTSSVAIELCQMDGGVTIAATVEQGVVPVKGFGAVLDAPCYQRGTLKPGEAREFEEEFSVWPGTTSLRGSIRIHRPGHGAVEIRSAPVLVSTAG